MDASRAYPNSRPIPAYPLHRKRPRSSRHPAVVTLPPPPLPSPLPPPPPPPPPRGYIPKPQDVTPLQFSIDNAHYRDALSKWHYHLIPATPTERWSRTVRWHQMSLPGSDIKLQAMVQLPLDPSGMPCSPFFCPVYYKILEIDQILEIYKCHEIPRNIQEMFSPSDRAKADRQALHDKIDDLVSISSTRSGSDGSYITSTRDTASNASCILASIYAEPEKWAGFLGQAIQSGSEILIAQPHDEAISAHSSITKAPSTLDN